MKTHHLNHNDMPNEAKRIFERAYPSYAGRKFKIRAVSGPVNMRSCWASGSRDYFKVVSFGGDIFEMPVQSMFDQKVSGSDSFTIPEGMAVVQHSIFMGKDMGLTILVPEQRVKGLLPAPKFELTDDQIKVLKIVGGYKAFARRDKAKYQGFSISRYDILIEELKVMGLLRKNGSITPDGRNY